MLSKKKTKLLAPRASLYPVPVTLVTCSDGTRTNVITISWTGILASHPPIIYISVRPERYSYGIFKRSERFCVNIPGIELLEAADFCGNSSGEENDKASYCGFDYDELIKGYPPVIRQCHHHLLCDKIIELPYGSHTSFVAEVKYEFIDEDCQEDGVPVYSKLNPIAYCRKDYFSLSEKIGTYGKVKSK